MKAIVRDRYGSFRLGEIDKPPVPDDAVLVRVRASSVNPVDWYDMTGRPYFARFLGGGFRRPKDPRLGSDFAGTVEAVGPGVTRFRPGDDVFGLKGGSYAEYVCVPEDGPMAPKPAGVTFEQAGAVGVAALTALQALRDKGRLEAGRRVLVNGASGGVGTFAVQIAKGMGAEVTGVCSTRNIDLVRSLGADHVVDYTQEDFTHSRARYDLVLDVAGSRPWRACKRILAEDAVFVLAGGSKRNRVLGPVGHMAGVMLASRLSGKRAVFFVAKPNQADVTALADLIEAGTVTPVVDRQYELGQLMEAMAYLGDGHARAKVAITVTA
jgi:NADPH:quinone reductase-like Zn-dependent oxidoreductase